MPRAAEGARLASALTSLEQVGLVERLANGRVRPAEPELETDEGVVLRYEEDRVTVLFEEEGYKTLAVPLVLERRLLERAG